MSKFKNKYRIESNRLQGWDYRNSACYFITICCKNKECFFGDITDGKIKLSVIGHIANSCWFEIPDHFPFISLHNHVIMPNHMHGIIEIQKPNNTVIDNSPIDNDTSNVETPKLGVSTATAPNTKSRTVDNAIVDDSMMDDSMMVVVQTPKLGVSTAAASNTKSRTVDASKKWNPKSLGIIINQYKRICTINARTINPDFAWQPNYHDHIIRNEKSYNNIFTYIVENPIKWQEDSFHPDILANQIIENIESGLNSFQDIADKIT